MIWSSYSQIPVSMSAIILKWTCLNLTIGRRLKKRRRLSCSYQRCGIGKPWFYRLFDSLSQKFGSDHSPLYLSAAHRHYRQPLQSADLLKKPAGCKKLKLRLPLSAQKPARKRSFTHRSIRLIPSNFSISHCAAGSDHRQRFFSLYRYADFIRNRFRKTKVRKFRTFGDFLNTHLYSEM